MEGEIEHTPSSSTKNKRPHGLRKESVPGNLSPGGVTVCSCLGQRMNFLPLRGGLPSCFVRFAQPQTNRPLKKSSFPGCSKRALPSSRRAGLRAGRQMQVESAKSRLRGSPRAFHLPVRQATLRVASRRIRSDFLPRRRVGESARGVLGCTPQRRRIRETQ